LSAFADRRSLARASSYVCAGRQSLWRRPGVLIRAGQCNLCKRSNDTSAAAEQKAGNCSLRYRGSGPCNNSLHTQPNKKQAPTSMDRSLSQPKRESVLDATEGHCTRRKARSSGCRTACRGCSIDSAGNGRAVQLLDMTIAEQGIRAVWMAPGRSVHELTATAHIVSGKFDNE